MEKAMDSRVFELMQTGKPFKSYIKTILGKVYVNILDPFSGQKEARLLTGNPKDKSNEGCIVDVWDEMGDAYFRRANKTHFERGFIISFQRKEEPAQKTDNELDEEQLVEWLKLPFLALQKNVNKLDSVAPVFRLIQKAKELEKSEKIIAFLERKLSEIQEKEYSTQEDEI